MGFALQAARGDQKHGFGLRRYIFQFREWRRNNDFLGGAQGSYYTDNDEGTYQPSALEGCMQYRVWGSASNEGQLTLYFGPCNKLC